MPFAPTALSQNLKAQLQDFATHHDFAELYREYDWNTDTWRSGFPGILELEKRITSAAKNRTLTELDVRSIAEWGGLINLAGVKCWQPLALPLYERDRPNRGIETDPLVPLRALLRAKQEGCIEGLGPTYLSKVLRFALPSEYGAIDTRIVRVFGVGDDDSKQQHWLSLRVSNRRHRWRILEKQSGWPTEYSTWVNILRFFAHLLHDSGQPCPHPEGFVTRGMRTRGDWACADVEMALFAYASACLPVGHCEL